MIPVVSSRRDKTATPVPHRVRYPPTEEFAPYEDESGPGALSPEDYALIPTGHLLSEPHAVPPGHPLLSVCRETCAMGGKLYQVECGRLDVCRADTGERLDTVDLAAYGLWPVGVAVVADFVCVALRDGTGIGFRA